MSNTPTSSEDLYWRLHGLSKILEGSGFIDESQHPDAYATILDAMAFVRGSQPVVREPLTDEQRMEVFNEATKRWDENLNLPWRVAILEQVEIAHGITQKGDSNAE